MHVTIIYYCQISYAWILNKINRFARLCNQFSFFFQIETWEVYFTFALYTQPKTFFSLSVPFAQKVSSGSVQMVPFTRKELVGDIEIKWLFIKVSLSLQFSLFRFSFRWSLSSFPPSNMLNRFSNRIIHCENMTSLSVIYYSWIMMFYYRLFVK